MRSTLRGALALILLGGMVRAAAAGPDDYAVTTVPSAVGMPLDEIKPKTVVFSDHRNDELAERGTGLLRFDDWGRARPLEKQFLNLFPAYIEPTVTVTRSGVSRRVKERLDMYVAEARFVLDKAPGAVDLGRYATLPMLERVDPAIKHRQIAVTETVAAKDPEHFPNRDPDRTWCDPQTVTICLRSRYQLEGKLPMGIMLANKLREGEKKIADYLEFDSEVRVLPPQSLDQPGLGKLTALDAPVTAALAQNIFAVNQVMEYGRFLAVLQPHPKDAGKTVATVFMVLALKADIFEKKKEFERVPVLRNLVPAAVLMGNSSFNTGNSISAGLPAYARNRVQAIAGMLQRD
jgi:hypothetical protein